MNLIDNKPFGGKLEYLSLFSPIKIYQGDIIIELYSGMPITAGNFEKLVQQGFYDGVIFHRVIEGFMLQGGDPDGTGMGGPGYEIKDEFINIRECISRNIVKINECVFTPDIDLNKIINTIPSQ